MEENQAYFEWVLAIIKSCKTPSQLEAAKLVVEYYKKKFGDKTYSEELLLAIVNQDSLFVIPPMPEYLPK